MTGDTLIIGLLIGGVVAGLTIALVGLIGRE